MTVTDSYDFSQLMAAGFRIRIDASGNLGFFDDTNTERLYISPNSAGVTRIMNAQLQLLSDMTFRLAALNFFKTIATVGFGLPPIYGLDNRSGVTAADGAPITLYVVPAGANQLFDAAIEIDATAFTSGTATYTLTYTENGVSQTIVVTATVLNVVTGVRRLIQPDASTNVTVQLTGVFTATCRLSAALMQLA